MPLYELVVIAAHATKFAPIQTLATTSTSLILANGGVIRTIDYFGQKTLPQKMKRGDESSELGDYWTLKFDANPPTVAALNERLRLDPRVLRWTTLKIGSTLAAVTASAEDPAMLYSRTLPSTAPVDEQSAPKKKLDIPGRRGYQ